jgi:hypothetical protein
MKSTYPVKILCLTKKRKNLLKSGRFTNLWIISKLNSRLESFRSRDYNVLEINKAKKRIRTLHRKKRISTIDLCFTMFYKDKKSRRNRKKLSINTG